MATKQTALVLVMPGEGDMELIGQTGGSIQLSPIYYGNESMGPHLQIVEGHTEEGKFIVDKVMSRARIKLKRSSEGALSLEIRKGDE